jgi:hypothetical protein
MRHSTSPSVIIIIIFVIIIEATGAGIVFANVAHSSRKISGLRLAGKLRLVVCETCGGHLRGSNTGEHSLSTLRPA